MAKCSRCNDLGYILDASNPQRIEKDYPWQFHCDCEKGRIWGERKRADECYTGLTRFLHGQDENYW